VSLQLRLTLAVSLVVAATLALAAAGAYALATQAFYQMAQEWVADDARELAASTDFLAPGSRRSSGKLASVDRFAQTCFRIVSVARGFADPETGETNRSFPLSEEGLRALRDGQPWSEIVVVQGEPVVVYNLPVPVNARVVGVAQVAQDIGDQARAARAQPQPGRRRRPAGVVCSDCGMAGFWRGPAAARADGPRCPLNSMAAQHRPAR